MTALLKVVNNERRLENWIDSFFEWSDVLGSPTLYRHWAGISAVSGALERKVWVQTLGRPLFPNTYIILVGPPGVGKTNLTSQISNFWNDLGDHVVAPSSVTKASLIDALADAKRIIPLPGQIPPVMEFNALLVNSNELGVLIPGYDNEFMSTLTDIYDGYQYKERKRGRDLKIQIDKPHMNLLAACTPNYLVSTLPEGAWEQGFMSRCILIYSGEMIRRSLFLEPEENERLRADLLHDLKIIGSRTGLIRFTSAARDAIEAWDQAGLVPVPDHPKLLSYCARRRAHMLKLAQVASLARSNDLILDVEDFQRAQDWMIEAEQFMPDIFKAMKTGGDQSAIRELYHFAYQQFMRTNGKPIPEHLLVEFLSERAPAHSVVRILELVVRADLFKVEFDYRTSRNMYTPKPKRGMELGD